MRPVVVTAILLVVLMFMSDSAAESLVEMCKNRHVAIPCRRNIGEGWFQMGNNRCVKAFYHNVHLNFDDAKKTCRKYKNGNINADLVSIHSMDELNIVECTMYRATTGKAHYWIGMYRIWLSGFVTALIWVDGTNVGFTRWAGGQPDNVLFNERCVEMNYWSWGLWNDRTCHAHLPYVCAIRV